ncbi:MAG: energy transducer TonB, partial [Oceanicoccus sp.]|uniref:energy transducer TonB n=1 Tax=Oceanicoccus sp. TaxID=2691044 RepID=UPI00262E4241
MKMSYIKSAVVASVLAVASSSAMAQDARSLDQLLDFVKQGQATEAKENRAREARFKNAKNRQAQLLAEAKVMRKKEENRSARLENTFEQNELKVAEKGRQLKERLGTLTELFGHLTSTAGDLRSSFANSLVSAQYPGRDEFLDQLIAKMTGAEQLPSIEEIERLWFEIQREMTESGKVVSFTAEVAKPGGEKESRTVVRVGTFNVISDEGRYLQYIAETDTLAELARQPSGAYMGWASDLAGSTSGKVPFGADPTGPSGGSFLAALINSPTIEERWHQGGNVGYAITAVGALAFLLAIWRLIVLAS